MGLLAFPGFFFKYSGPLRLIFINYITGENYTPKLTNNSQTLSSLESGWSV